MIQDVSEKLPVAPLKPSLSSADGDCVHSATVSEVTEISLPSLDHSNGHSTLEGADFGALNGAAAKQNGSIISGDNHKGTANSNNMTVQGASIPNGDSAKQNGVAHLEPGQINEDLYSRQL